MRGEFLQDIINDAKGGMRVGDIALKYGKEKDRVYTILSRNKIKATPATNIIRGKYTKDILKYHQEGMPVRRICELLNIKSDIVYSALNLRGVSANHAIFIRTKKLNHDYFSVINTQEKAYFLGLIYSDGYIHPKSNKISLSLTEADSYLIYLFVKAVKSDAPVSIIYSKNSIRSGRKVQLYSDKMVLDLIDKGCVERKSLVKEFPKNVPDELIWHFLRGYFDGNGCISINHRQKRISIDSSNRFIEQLIEFLSTKYGMNPYLSKRKNHSEIIIYRQKDVDKFGVLIYDNCTVFMKRKKDKLDAERPPRDYYTRFHKQKTA